MAVSSAASAPARGAVRRAAGFCRFAVAVQYHGGSFLGFTYQGPSGEDCLLQRRKRKSGGLGGRVDLRGHRSVEGRLREALDELLGKERWENIQVSSRTDRGVHALKNTFHVDVQLSNNNTNDDHDKENNNGNAHFEEAEQQQQQQKDRHVEAEKIERKLRDGLNFYLSRQSRGFDDGKHKNPKTRQNPMMNEMRILNASKSPEYMDNPYALTEEGRAKNQPVKVDWNARFSATRRTYVYRLLCYFPRQQRSSQNENKEHCEPSSSFSPAAPMDDWHYGYGIPFEWDRAWCLPQSHAHPLDLDAMKEAAEYFVGTHDFSSFRGRLCQRHSPIVTMEAVTIEECPPRASFGGSDSGHYYQHQQQQQRQHEQQLVTMTFVANSFLYRQVRNMVGCLVEVGKHGGRLSPKDVRDLVATDWKAASGDDNAAGKEGDAPSPTAPTTETYKHRPYSTAPPQGLFLVDVQHGNFWF